MPRVLRGVLHQRARAAGHLGEDLRQGDLATTERTDVEEWKQNYPIYINHHAIYKKKHPTVVPIVSYKLYPHSLSPQNHQNLHHVLPLTLRTAPPSPPTSRPRPIDLAGPETRLPGELLPRQDARRGARSPCRGVGDPVGTTFAVPVP